MTRVSGLLLQMPQLFLLFRQWLLSWHTTIDGYPENNDLKMQRRVISLHRWQEKSTAAGGYVKWCPPAVIFPQKYARWHFQNADGRDNAVILRPMDSILGLHRARLGLRLRHDFQQYTKEKFAPPCLFSIFLSRVRPDVTTQTN